MTSPIEGTGPVSREEASAELEKIATDTTHPHHLGYHRGLPATNDYIDGIYKRISPGASPTGEGTQRPIVRGEIVPTAPDEAIDAAFRSAVVTAVKERGIDVAGSYTESDRLYGGKAGEALADLLWGRTTLGLAPKAEVDAYVVERSFFADLNKIRTAPPSSTSEHPTVEAFNASLDAALKERGMNRAALAELEDHIFSGREAEYKHFVKYLDSFPPGARLNAYVRSAEALMAFSRLCQARS